MDLYIKKNEEEEEAKLQINIDTNHTKCISKCHVKVK